VLAALGMLGGHFWLGDALHSLAFWHAPETWFERLTSLQTLYPGVFALADGHDAGGHGAHGDHVAHLAHTLAVSVSLAVALGGVALAYWIYGRGWERSQRITDGVTGTLGEVYHAVSNKYFVDEMVDATVLRGSQQLALLNRRFDENVVDGIVNGAGHIGRSSGFLSAWFDRIFVDGLVNGVAAIAQTFGSAVRLMQTGRVQQYVAFAVGGSLMAAAWLILS
jgi:NADH-quinone oxidoreductase subunit L